MCYSGYIGHNDHYGDFLIGKEVINNHYEFLLPPTANLDIDYHTDISRFAASDFSSEGLIDLNMEDDNFVDAIEIKEFIGLDFKPKTKLYVGSPTGKKVEATYKMGWASIETISMFRVKKWDAQYHGYILDNGVFAEFKNNIQFDEDRFIKKLHEVEDNKMFPDFVVAPDIVGGGLDSLAYSVNFMLKIEFCPFPKYLVVQDGMNIKDVEPYLNKENNKESIEFDGIFVGGRPTFLGFGKKQTKEIEWKLRTMEKWTQLAHKYNKKCHIGRVSSIQRYDYARSIRADSCDSSVLNFSPKVFKRYEKASRQAILEF